MKILKKYAVLLSLLLSVTANAQVIDSTKAADTAKVKTGRFKTAANVIRNSVLSIPGDFGRMGHEVSKDWGQTAAYAGGIALFVLADKPVTKFYQDKVEQNIDYSLPSIAPKGTDIPFLQGNDIYITYSLMGIYGGSLVANSAKGQRAAINGFKALTYSYVIVHLGMKSLFGRQRPDPTLSNGINPAYPYTQNPHDFFNFHGITFNRDQEGTAFPSFHATAYFAVAKVLAMEFNNYWIPYTLVAAVFCSDIEAHQHWVGDMVAGGVIGTLIGKGIVLSSRRQEAKDKLRRQGLGANRDRKFDGDYRLMPNVSSRMVGLNLSLHF